MLNGLCRTSSFMSSSAKANPFIISVTFVLGFFFFFFLVRSLHCPHPVSLGFLGFDLEAYGVF